MLEISKAALLIEDVLDILFEVGNGTTEEDLVEAAEKLLKFRDEFFNPLRLTSELLAKVMKSTTFNE